MSSTAASIEEAASVDVRWVMKVFRKAVEAEERVNLFRKLSNFRTRGCSAHQKKGLETLICFATKILKIGPKLRELEP